MMQFLAENTTFMISIIVFMICVIIGFFGDMYLKKHNKIQNIFNFKRKPKDRVKKEEVKTGETADSSLNLQNDMNQVNNNMHQEVSSSIAPTKIDLEKATLDAFENDMPAENKPVDMLDQPVTFLNVNVNVDDEINNMF